MLKKIHRCIDHLLTHRLLWFERTLLFWLALGWALTSRLWLNHRHFPLAASFNFLPDIPWPLDMVWFGGNFVLIALLALQVKIKYKKIIAMDHRHFRLILLLSSLLMPLWDNNRLNSWYYQYISFLAVLTWYHWRSPGLKKIFKTEISFESTLNYCRIIVACVYIWGGLQKLNHSFIHSVFPWFVNPITQHLSLSQEFIQGWAIFTLFMEFSFGLGLLWSKTRNWVVLILLPFHILILFLLGPWGHNYDSGVWPWNLAMVCFAFFLFYRTPHVNFRHILWGDPSSIPARMPNYYWQRFALGLYLFLPSLNFINLWDSYLSFCMFSGNTKKVHFFLNPNTYKKLPSYLLKYVNHDGQYYYFDFFQFAYEDTNYTPIPELRNYRATKKFLCTFSENPRDVLMVVQIPPAPWSNEGVEMVENCLMEEGTSRKMASEELEDE